MRTTHEHDAAERDGRERDRRPAQTSGSIRVSFVGGIDRLERQIIAVGREFGIDVEVHNGRTGGAGTARLASVVRRSHLVVVVTGTNSHNAVRVVKREAAKVGVPVRIVSFCGAATARAFLADFAAGPELRTSSSCERGREASSDP